MRKVHATVVYAHRADDNGKYYSLLTIECHTTQGNSITLLSLSPNDFDTPIELTFNTFQAMMDIILSYLKRNDFYTQKWYNFGKYWYDISFISTDEPWDIKRYWSWR